MPTLLEQKTSLASPFIAPSGLPVSILVADDTLLLRRLLIAQLTQEPDFHILGEAGDGREAVEKTLHLRPDIVLMDLDMPHLNGIQATERILAQLPYTKIIMLTAHHGLARMGKLVGAFDCLEKDCTPQQLLDTIRKARLRPLGLNGESADDRHEGAVEKIASRASLTEREKLTLMRAMRTELTIEQIAGVISEESGQDCSISSVKHSLDRVLTKLRVEPRTRASLVRYVLEFEKAHPGNDEESADAESRRAKPEISLP